MAAEISIGDIRRVLVDDLGLTPDRAVLALVSGEAIGPVQGGARALARAIVLSADTVMMPAFTYQTQVVPQVGPPQNALAYGEGSAQNSRATFFRPGLSVHPDCGSVAEALRCEKGVLRSLHPVLSFVAAGPQARAALASQTRANPLSPLIWLEARGGVVLMIGVDQRHNVAWHLAEQRAGRRTFTRWALTTNGIVELTRMPGCREGFNAVWEELMPYTRAAQLGMARAELIDLAPALAYIEARLRHDPNFMLCRKPTCLSCRTREV